MAPSAVRPLFVLPRRERERERESTRARATFAFPSSPFALAPKRTTAGRVALSNCSLSSISLFAAVAPRRTSVRRCCFDRGASSCASVPPAPHRPTAGWEKSLPPLASQRAPDVAPKVAAPAAEAVGELSRADPTPAEHGGLLCVRPFLRQPTCHTRPRPFLSFLFNRVSRGRCLREPLSNSDLPSTPSFYVKSAPTICLRQLSRLYVIIFAFPDHLHTEQVSDVTCMPRGLRRAPASDEAPR